MKKMLCAFAALILALTPLTALAATDITGAWIGEMNSDNGNLELTFTFKQEGAKLTGTVQGPQGDPLNLTEGKVDGDKISFKVTYNGMVFTDEGSIAGDQIKLTLKSDQGDFTGAMTLKRSDAAKTSPAIRTEP